MLFNSLTYAWFLPLAFALYWGLGRLRNGLRMQNIFLILSGYVFYGWWDWRFLLLLFTATAVDFWVGLLMDRHKEGRPPWWTLAISLAMNLGMLGTFKYFDFFAKSFMRAMGELGIQVDLPLLQVLLPVGISFYTFQTMSYTIDVYRGKLQATRDPIAFFAFVSFFPPLLAGPIERASHLLPQVLRPRIFSYPLAVTGLRLILWGIFKKVVIADTMAAYVGFVFDGTSAPSGVEALVAMFLFMVQIYCDFSGYTDVARGSARLLGFELMVNFDRPYFAASLQEFWARWHISLTSWFRDYLYLPLGGNRVASWRMYLNVVIVFLVSGLWHGAAWTFVLFGLIHGIWFGIERSLRLRTRLPRLLQHVLTLAVVAVGFVFFRAGSVTRSLQVLRSLGNWAGENAHFEGLTADLSLVWPLGLVMLYLAGLTAFLFALDGLFDFSQVDGRFSRLPRWSRWTVYYLLIAWLLVLGAYGQPQQFIYFQF